MWYSPCLSIILAKESAVHEWLESEEFWPELSLIYPQLIYPQLYSKKNMQKCLFMHRKEDLKFINWVVKKK